MKVYALLSYSGDAHEGDTAIEDIFSTLEKATAAKAEAQKKRSLDDFWIEVWEVK